MTLQMGLTLIVLLFMVIGFFTGKLSYGLITMTCVMVLALLGVITPETAFAGFSNTNIILMAVMFAINQAVGKASYSEIVKRRIAVLQKKNGFILLMGIIGFSIVLVQFMGMTPTMTFMLLIVQTLDDDTDMCQSRMYFLIAAISCAWFARLPIGANAAMPLVSNASYEDMVGGNQDYLLGMFDLLKGGFIPSIALTIYCILAWRLIPRTKISPDAVGAYHDPNAHVGYSKRTDTIVTLVLIVVIVGMALNRQIGSFSYIIVSACVLVLIFTNVLSLKEAVSALTCDTVWMAAGLTAVSTALTNSGLAEAVGNGILNILGENPSGLYVSFIFSLVTVLLTTFLNNTAVILAFTPIGVSVALAGGMNPRAVALVISLSASLGLGFPTASNIASIAFAVCHHNPLKTAKFVIPFLIIGVITITLSCNMFFPVY